MGFVLGAEEFKENSRTVEVNWEDTSVTLLIADPLDLWREKEAAVYRRSRPQDSLHLEVLATTLQWEVVHYAGKVASGELTFENWNDRVHAIKRRFNSVLGDSRLKARLQELNVPEINGFMEAFT